MLPVAEITLIDLLEEIRSGRYHRQISAYRSAIEIHGKDHDDAKALKKSLPAHTLSGRIEGGLKDAMIEGRMDHSGIIQLDLDGIEDPAKMRDELIQDAHVIAAWISPSGTGVKGIAAMSRVSTEEDHKLAFLAAEKHFAGIGLELDQACKNTNRLCFVSSDPDIKIRDGEIVEFQPIQSSASKTKPTTTRNAGFPEPPEHGIHDWLMRAAWHCRRSGMSEDATIERLNTYEPTLRRKYQSNEVEDAVEKVFKAIDIPVFFYDGVKYHMDTRAEFVPMDTRSVERHMKGRGMIREEIDRALCDIQTENFISYAGPLAGLQRGIHESGGQKLLATISPKIIAPQVMAWDTLKKVFSGLLYDEEHGDHQVKVFLGWLKFARESLVSGRRRPGQALAIAGPRNSGKSLLIDIAEAAMGGRRSNPYPHFTGRTNFNSDIAGAELLAVDDEAGSIDLRARKNLAAAIKSNLFSGAVRIEGKHKSAFTLRPVWRMMIALNDESESLLVLPPMTEDITDKIILLKCARRPLPMPAHTLEERDRFFQQLLSELPGLLAYLERWDPPADLRDERCGIAAFHHPDLLSALYELSPEGQLAELIDTAAAIGGIVLPWTGTAATLKAVLCSCDETKREAEKLLSYAGTAGKYLGRLEGSRTSRLGQSDGVQRWRIDPPEGVKE